MMVCGVLEEALFFSSAADVRLHLRLLGDLEKKLASWGSARWHPLGMSVGITSCFEME